MFSSAKGFLVGKSERSLKRNMNRRPIGPMGNAVGYLRTMITAISIKTNQVSVVLKC